VRYTEDRILKNEVYKLKMIGKNISQERQGSQAQVAGNCSPMYSGGRKQSLANSS
jgi:hypothetical protein